LVDFSDLCEKCGSYAHGYNSESCIFYSESLRKKMRQYELDEQKREEKRKEYQLQKKIKNQQLYNCKFCKVMQKNKKCLDGLCGRCCTCGVHKRNPK